MPYAWGHDKKAYAYEFVLVHTLHDGDSLEISQKSHKTPMAISHFSLYVFAV